MIYELINASFNTSALINVLQTSIVNYEVIQKTSIQQYNQEQKNDQYFTDKQYRREDESSFDHRDEYSNDRRNDDYSNDRRDKFRDRSNDKFQSNDHSKRCFLCEKFDC